MLEYISGLRITHPAFYEVFTEDEIYQLFRPPERAVPFYIWGDSPEFSGVNEGVLKCTSQPIILGHLDEEILIDQALRHSPWRTYNKSEAVWHYVPLFFSTMLHNTCFEVEITKITDAVSRVFTTPEWKQWNGANFFHITGLYHEQNRARQQAEWAFSKLHVVTDVDHFRFTAPSIKHEVVPDARDCSVTGPYGTPVLFRNAKTYPYGELESYKMPGGIWQNVKARRKYNFFFFGQADGRDAYFLRRAMLRKIPGFAEPNALITTNYHSLRAPFNKKRCDFQTPGASLSNCMVLGAEKKDTRVAELLMNSKYGLHLRGDTIGSSRLIDLISTQTLPVIISKDFYSVSTWSQCYAPWRRFAFFLTEDDFLAFPYKALQRVIDASDDDAEMEKRFRLLEYYRLELGIGYPNAEGVHRLLQRLTLACHPEAMLRHHGISKAELTCPFEDRGFGSAFSRLEDVDGENPWRNSVLKVQPKKKRKRFMNANTSNNSTMMIQANQTTP